MLYLYTYIFFSLRVSVNWPNLKYIYPWPKQSEQIFYLGFLYIWKFCSIKKGIRMIKHFHQLLCNFLVSCLCLSPKVSFRASHRSELSAWYTLGGTFETLNAWTMLLSTSGWVCYNFSDPGQRLPMADAVVPSGFW